MLHYSPNITTGNTTLTVNTNILHNNGQTSTNNSPKKYVSYYHSLFIIIELYPIYNNLMFNGHLLVTLHTGMKKENQN
jgi:hypothetical protein